MAEIFKKTIYDSIHGFIKLSQTEDRIINTPYFQRLRWIKQLGWSHYIYPGATHTRFAHALGVMAVMDKIIRSIGREGTPFHRKMRLAALLHDIGTFPFSHSVEHGYINHNKNQIQSGKKVGGANHEELGSHIITKTDFEGGITSLLKAEGIDPKEMAQLIQGQSSDPLANQLIHSDIDADRIDYLLRDSHHTGLKYGVFDLEYLISNFRAVRVGKEEVLAINESALTAVEYFLISRYTWYSQIINDGTGYKFDLLATRLAEYLIETGGMASFEELKHQVSHAPKTFFGFNDNYFTNKLQDILVNTSNSLKPSAMILQQAEMLMFRQAPQQIKTSPFEPSLVQSVEERHQLIDSIHEAVTWLREKIAHLPQAWIIEDIPSRDVIFTRSLESLKKKTDFQHSVQIVDRENNLKFLVDMPHSIIRVLSPYQNFIPRVYANRQTFKYLQEKGYLTELEKRFGLKSKKTA